MAASQGSAYWQERKYAFRKLLVTVSEKLTESEARQIEFLRELPKSTTRMREGLDVLAELRKRGEFSSKKVQPLIDLLQEIKRHDIAEYVRDSYQATNPDISKLEGAGLRLVYTHPLFRGIWAYMGQSVWDQPHAKI